MEEKIKRLQEIVLKSDNIVFFGGAGVSTESGLKDFRSVDGLYNEVYKYPPEEILSDRFFYSNTTEFYRFYYDKLLIDGVMPNNAHKKLAEMESVGKLKAVVTQNIDGLHQKAGSEVVYELHGSTDRNYCLRCGKFFSGDEMFEFKEKGDMLPRCECGGVIKPDVVLYGEGLSDDTVKNSIIAIANADTLIVAGTSLTVYPASGFINYFRGKNLVLINKAKTQLEAKATLVINEKVGEVLSQINL